jgi:hypothetical protein
MTNPNRNAYDDDLLREIAEYNARHQATHNSINNFSDADDYTAADWADEDEQDWLEFQARHKKGQGGNER